MDDNLSKITPEKVMEILREKTNSDVPRLKRIECANHELFEKLGCPKKITKKLAEELIEWNDVICTDMSDIITRSISDIDKYSDLLDIANLNLDKSNLKNLYLDNLESIISTFTAFSYKNLGVLLSKVAINSKLASRINNLKLLCSYSKKKNLSNHMRKYLLESLIYEISYQRTYILIFNNNIKDFKDSCFPLGLLLYDIPANQDNKLNFLNELNKAYELIENKE